MKKVILPLWISILASIFSNLIYAQSWDQMGSNINGNAIDILGYSLSLSEDGQTMAIGAPNHTIINDGSFEYEKGKVEIYNWNTVINNWIPKGSIIYGNNNYENLGSSVSLSADGNVLVISSPTNDATNAAAGQIRVFNWTNNNWEQRGQDINSSAVGEGFGTSVHINESGNVIAVGIPKDSSNGFDIGLVRIYEWNGSSWVQKGGDLNGVVIGDQFGSSLELSNDGNTIAIGAPSNVANSSATEPGYAKIFTWNNTNWVQKGATLIGESVGNLFGKSLSLSANGDKIAIGAPRNSGEPGWLSGHVRVFSWNNNDWVQMGQDIDGEEFEDLSGDGVSLSSNGNTVAIGAIGNYIGGHVRVFSWSDNSWQQKGGDLEGENSNDAFGRELSLSGNGSIIAIAAPQHSINGTLSGQVRVYDGSTFPVSIKQPEIRITKAYPNPVLKDGEFHITFDKTLKHVHVKILNYTGQILDVQKFDLAKNIDLKINAPKGFYFIKIETEEGSEAVYKIYKN